MEIYLDHASTTPLSEAVIETIDKNLKTCYGNPSSLHRLGLKSEKGIKSAKEMVAKLIKCTEREIIFTSGGTEANNLAIKGSVGNKRGRIITTSIEHPSVSGPISYFESMGCEVVYLPVNSAGVIDEDAVSDALTQNTILVSVMHVNNEIGSIQPIEKIANSIKKFNFEHGLNIKFHVDAVQSFGKLTLDMKSLPIDLLTFSAHKINGLKGIGGLFVRNKSDLNPQLHGGQQEYSIRPGTENLLGILALSVAVEEKIKMKNQLFIEVEKYKNIMLERFKEVDFIKINSIGGSPYILNISIIGTKGEVMLHSLEMDGVYVSTGSACSSKKRNQSHVLKAMELTDDVIEGAIRISFGNGLCEETIEKASDLIIEKGNEIRRIINKKGR